MLQEFEGNIRRRFILPASFTWLCWLAVNFFYSSELNRAIKENGHQLISLIARAIVQSYLIKSFLLNIKQDGNTLPNGPVVISPDGLIPSLYREAIIASYG